MVDRVIEIAKAELDYCGDNSGKSKYFSELFPNEKAKPYCVPFIEWIFIQAYGEDRAKELLHIDKYVQSAVALMNYFKQANSWYYQQCEVGWLVFLRVGNEATNHVELIIDIDNDKLTCVGGNIDNMVKFVTHNINDREIAGYGKIEYKDKTE
jgi:hypothetical protein